MNHKHLWVVAGTPGWLQTDTDSAGSIPVHASLAAHLDPIDTATVACLDIDVPEEATGAGAELTVEDLIALRDAIDGFLTGLPEVQ